MADIEKYSYSHKEVVEALIKQEGLHEEIWILTIELGISAANLDPTEDQMLPTAVIPVTKIGLTRADKENTLSVDAAKVNPA